LLVRFGDVTGRLVPVLWSRILFLVRLGQRIVLAWVVRIGLRIIIAGLRF
jgi:hypothetical protein